jgi:hypothetical protein
MTTLTSINYGIRYQLCRESLHGMKELYCFDMRPIDILNVDDERNMKKEGLVDEKAPR